MGSRLGVFFSSLFLAQKNLFLVPYRRSVFLRSFGAGQVLRVRGTAGVLDIFMGLPNSSLRASVPKKYRFGFDVTLSPLKHVPVTLTTIRGLTCCVTQRPCVIVGLGAWGAKYGQPGWFRKKFFVACRSGARFKWLCSLSPCLGSIWAQFIPVGLFISALYMGGLSSFATRPQVFSLFFLFQADWLCTPQGEGFLELGGVELFKDLAAMSHHTLLRYCISSLIQNSSEIDYRPRQARVINTAFSELAFSRPLFTYLVPEVETLPFDLFLCCLVFYVVWLLMAVPKHKRRLVVVFFRTPQKLVIKLRSLRESYQSQPLRFLVAKAGNQKIFPFSRGGLFCGEGAYFLRNIFCFINAYPKIDFDCTDDLLICDFRFISAWTIRMPFRSSIVPSLGSYCYYNNPFQYVFLFNQSSSRFVTLFGWFLKDRAFSYPFLVNFFWKLYNKFEVCRPKPMRRFWRKWFSEISQLRDFVIIGGAALSSISSVLCWSAFFVRQAFWGTQAVARKLNTRLVVRSFFALGQFFSFFSIWVTSVLSESAEDSMLTPEDLVSSMLPTSSTCVKRVPAPQREWILFFKFPSLEAETLCYSFLGDLPLRPRISNGRPQ